MGLEIVPMAPAMVGPCAAIAATAPDPWRPEDLEQAVTDPNRRCFAALLDGHPVGFACFLAVPGGDNADLQLVAVAPECRRQGVARALLQHALASLANEGVTRVLLEARASNTAAIALYRGLGFAHLADRRAMYAHPQEDGVLMGRGLSPHTDTDTKEANA